MNRLTSSSNNSVRGGKISSSIISNINEVPVILKALYTYHAQSPKELSFSKGEFFQVAGQDGEWYEVNSPESGKRGMVPKNYFESYSKSRVVSSQSILTSLQEASQLSTAGSLYAIVLYDFKAEKSDELTAHAGENLFICAHHSYEWFIAKPIGRLGGPGLIPVCFVSVVDITSGHATGNDVKNDIESVNLPTVVEWKSNIAKYKASNIPLVFSESQGRGGHAVSAPPCQTSSSPTRNFDKLVVKSAAVDSFILEGEKYWFYVICEFDDDSTHFLKRYYEDFYDLQVQLLDTYPAEAGKLRDGTGQWTKRIMPYIPGPVPYVTDLITQKRRDDLDTYVKELIALSPHISQSTLVKSLFAVRKNGFDIAVLKQQRNSAKNLAHLPGNQNRHKLSHDELSLTCNDSKLHDKMELLSLREKSKQNQSQTNITSIMVPAPNPKLSKIKFYYKDDIFALLLPYTITFQELHQKIAPRIDTNSFHMYTKIGDILGPEITTDEQVAELIQNKLKITVLDAL